MNSSELTKAILAISILTCSTTFVVQAHSLKEKIADCSCDQACYTEEVSNVSCSGDKVTFNSKGLPHHSHALMTGITATNQQFPTPHDYDFSIKRNPTQNTNPTPTVAGAIGVAVNGIPLFDPSTQGPIVAATGKPPSAFEEGELDTCGGHAGRGDDYHYHMAPKCLIQDLGAQAIDVNRQPIGYAADGFPILALGWFDKSNDIEDKLDTCRGAQDADGKYFYNVKASGDYAILDCYSGSTTGFARDRWEKRLDASGNVIDGMPLKFTITNNKSETLNGQSCFTMSGTLGSNIQVRLNSGTASRVSGTQGSIFYCSQQCYGQFIEDKSGGRGRTAIFERHISGCPAGLTAASNNGFEAYQGN